MRNKFLLLIVLISFITSLGIGLKRIKIESKNKKIEITMDYPALLEFSGYSEKDLFKAIEEFKKAGAVSIALPEMNLSDLAKEGRIYYTTGNLILRRIMPLRQVIMGRTYIFLEDKELYNRILEGLIEKLGREKTMGSYFSRFYIIEVNENINKIEKIPLGIDFDLVEKLERLGFPVVIRLKNSPYLNEESLDKIFRKLRFHKNYIRTLIFEGEEVLGYEKLIKFVSYKIKEENLNFGFIEFAEQKGDREFAFFSLPNVIRVHSIEAQEMKNLTPQLSIERYLRAVKERKVRICYLRPYLPTSPGVDYVKFNSDYISEIKNKLINSGYKVGVAKNYENYENSNFLIFLIFAGVISAFIFLWRSVLSFTFNFKYKNVKYQLIDRGILIILLILSVLLYYFSANFILKIFSLISAIIFPVIALVINYPKREIKEFSERILKSVLRFLITSFFTIIGGFLISGLLFDLKFFLRIDQFLGVKLAHILPLFLIFLIFSSGIFDNKEGELQKEEIKLKFENFLEKSVLNRQIIILSIFLIAVLILILRSGNEAEFLTSPFELKFRSLLEKIFIIRPRTKEFLIGHPFLILFYYLLYSNRKKYLTFFLLLGAVGQISIINTFCHIHSPLIYSILRILNGIILGIFLGIIIIILDKIIFKGIKEN